MRDIPKPRQIEIFRQLMIATAPLDIETLKKKLQKSERTIRYDIQDLKRICQEYGIELGYLTKRGYYIPASQKVEGSTLLLQWESGNKNSFLDEDEEERFTSLFFYLLIQKGYVTAEKLADVYLASKSTLNRGLGHLEEYFGGNFRLKIQKAQGYRLEGDELEIRKQAVKILAGRFMGNYTVDDWYLLLPEELKDRITSQHIRDMGWKIQQMNGKYNVWISNTAYLNLLSYCIVRRVRAAILKETRDETITEEGYAAELLAKLTEEDGRGYNRQELEWLSQILYDYSICTKGYSSIIDKETGNTRIEDVKKLLAIVKELLA